MKKHRLYEGKFKSELSSRAKTRSALFICSATRADCIYMQLSRGAIAQAVSRRLPTAAARVQTRVWLCGIL
jgi:hypothetical protein